MIFLGLAFFIGKTIGTEECGGEMSIKKQTIDSLSIENKKSLKDLSQLLTVLNNL